MFLRSCAVFALIVAGCASGRGSQSGSDANQELDARVGSDGNALPSDRDAQPTKPDAAPPDAAKPDAAQPDAAKPDAAQPDAAKPDAAPPDAAKPDAAQPDAMVPAGDASTPAVVAPSALVINEIEVNCPGDDYEEFVEVLNRTGKSIELSGVALVHVNGAGANEELDRFLLASATRGDGSKVSALAPGEILVLAQQGSTVLANLPSDTPRIVHTTPLQNGPDVLFIEDGHGTVIDSVAYESNIAGYGEGASTQGDLGDDRGLSRCPAGSDTDNNADDFVRAKLTPASSNACP